MSRRGVFLVTREAMAELLRLPDGHHLEAIVQSADDIVIGRYQIVASGPSFPLVAEGSVPRRYAPLVVDGRIQAAVPE